MQYILSSITITTPNTNNQANGVTMLTLDVIKAQLKDRNIRAVAKACGLHENTIYNLIKSENPSYKTAEILSNYLEGKAV